MASSKATQQFVPIKEIREGIVILKDGSMRAIVMTSSLNFALKSEEGQNSLIFQFQNFLNSLDFTVQIFIQSRRLDIRPYLALLEDTYKQQVSDLLKIQTREYIEFIKSFTDNTSIMTKGFFVVVPYSPTVISKGGKGVKGLLNKDKGRQQGDLLTFEEHRSQLQQRVSVVEQGLSRVGLRIVQLGTEEIIEMFYKLFNPGSTEKPIKIR